MNWLKIITKSGRQSIARELLKDYLTPEQGAKWAAKGVNSLLDKVNDKTLLASVANNVNNVANLCAKVADAVRDGEVSPDEAATITQSVQALAGTVLTQERLDSLIEAVVAKVP